MAIQSSFYTPDGSTRTFPSTKHIASKQHMAVWFRRLTDSVWVVQNVSTYELINNTAVLVEAPDVALYDNIEIRVADTQDELTDSPSEISIVAGIATEVVNVSDNMSDVQFVADNISVIGAEKLIANVPNFTSLQAVNTTHTTKVNLTELHPGITESGGTFTWNPLADKATANAGTIIDPSVSLALQGTGTGTGCWIRQTSVVKAIDFGVIGDYDTDDTDAIDKVLAFAAPLGLTVDFEDLICRYTGTLTLPDGISIKGNAAPKIAAFPQFGGDKSKLRPGYKHLINGAAIIFDSTGTTATYTTNRSDKFASTVPMVQYLEHNPISIKGIAFIQDMDVLDAGGSLTSISNDNRATAYTSGFINNSTLSNISDFTLFGYFDDAGYIIHNQDGGNIDPDYINNIDVNITGGLAIIGHDTAAGASSEGLTGSKWIGCGIYGADHHTRADGFYTTVQALFIDGLVGTSGIRGHSFTGCNVRTYANDAVEFDNTNDIHFVDCVWEFPALSGVTGADATGGFVGTVNTGDFVAVGCAGTGDPKFLTFISQIGGNFQIIGAGLYDGAVFGKGGQGIRIAGTGPSNDDAYIQITNDLSSTVTGWRINKDDSEQELSILFNNSQAFALNESGQISSNLSVENTTKTISAGVLDISGSTSVQFSVNGEGSVADDLETITAPGTANQIIIIKSNITASPITCKDGTGNLRLSGDRVLSNPQDRLMLIYDSTNWCELSYADNTI